MADKPYRVAIMARVSTEKQGEEDKISLPDQYRVCRQHAAAQDWEVVKELEDKYTGMKANRPGLLTAIDLARRGQIDGVLALNRDRLCRGTDVRGWFTIELEQYGARIHYTDTPNLEDTPTGKFVDHSMSGVAQLVRDMIVKGLKDGREARVTQNGQILHNGTPPFGYEFNDPHDRTQYVKNDDEAPWVKAIFEQYAEGRSPRQIADWMNTTPGAPRPRRADNWSRSAIRDILLRDDYTGTGTRLGREIPKDEHGRPLTKRAKKVPEKAVEMTFPKLIEPELWRRVEAMRKEAVHHTNGGNTDPDAALFKGTGRVICVSCGRGMTYEGQNARTDRKNKGLYRCRHSKGKCPYPASYSAPRIDEIALGMIRRIVMDEKWHEARFKASMETGADFDQEIDAATKAVAKLYQRRKNLQGQLSDLAKTDPLLESTQDELRGVLEQLKAAKEHEADLLVQRARAKQDAENLRDFGTWVASHREGFDQLDYTRLRYLATIVGLEVRVTRAPEGNNVRMLAGIGPPIRFIADQIANRAELGDLSTWDRLRLEHEAPESAAEELSRVTFDGSPTNHSSRRARRSSICGGEPRYRRSGGILYSHLCGRRHRESDRDACIPSVKPFCASGRNDDVSIIHALHHTV